MHIISRTKWASGVFSTRARGFIIPQTVSGFPDFDRLALKGSLRRFPTCMLAITDPRGKPDAFFGPGRQYGSLDKT
jgi:hypothetical protein